MLATRSDGIWKKAEFNGTAKEYFGIWIVNTLLTIVTLGIYAPWAKVRRNRYFYANTFLNGHSFDYNATGGQLLKGWLMVGAYLIAYKTLAQFYPMAALAVFALVLLILPWVVQRGLRFKARVTSYRNVRFQFTGRLGPAFLSVLLGGVLSFASLGLLAPIGSWWFQRYMINNLRFGDREFKTEGRIWSLYKSMVLPVLIMIGGMVPAFLVVGFIREREYMGLSDIYSHGRWFTWIVKILFHYATILPILFAYYFTTLVYRIGVRNVMISSTRYDDTHLLLSNVPRLKYSWVVLSNAMLTLASLGLLRPWAAIRERKLIIQHTGIWIFGELPDVTAISHQEGDVFSSEFLDSDGFDFGF